MPKISVIIPAAGAGRRFGLNGNKVFQQIGGRPLFMLALEVFSSRQDVCQIQLVVSVDDIEQVTEQFDRDIASARVAIVSGGATRSESVRNALGGVSDEAELVCVHDAVRPCVAQEWINDVFAEAAKTGAAILAYPVHGTLKKVLPGNVIDRTVAREGLWQAQTPQVFRKDLLVAAYAGDVSGVTDDAQLVEAAGHPVSVVMGDPRNIKITTPCDLALAAAVIDTLPKSKGPSQ